MIYEKVIDPKSAAEGDILVFNYRGRTRCTLVIEKQSEYNFLGWDFTVFDNLDQSGNYRNFLYEKIQGVATQVVFDGKPARPKTVEVMDGKVLVSPKPSLLKRLINFLKGA